MKITGWKLVATWKDEKTGIPIVENVVDIPDRVSNRIDEFLNEVEEKPEIVSVYELNDKFEDLQKHVQESKRALQQQAIDVSRMAKIIGDVRYVLSEFKDSLDNLEDDLKSDYNGDE